MSIVGLYDSIALIQLWLYAALAILALLQWRRDPNAAAAWLCVAFVVLTIFFVVDSANPVRGTAAEWLDTVSVALLVLFPYSLYRFTSSLIGPIEWLRFLAPALTAAVGLTALGLPLSSDDSGWVELWVTALLVQWVLLSGVVVVRLWRAGTAQPTIARRRMRTISAAAAAVAVAAVVQGQLSEDGASRLLVQTLLLVSAPLMWVGFVPPYSLRRWWRRGEDKELRQAELTLMEAVTTGEVTELLLRHARAVLGGEEAILETIDGELVDRNVILEDHADESARPSEYSTVTVEMRAHRLRVLTNAVMSFFGREEIARLEGLAAVADIALERNRLFDEQRLLAAIVESSSDAIITKALDETITSWNLGAERMYGYRSEEVVGRPITILMPRDMESDMAWLLQEVKDGRTVDHYETLRQTKDGRILNVALSVSPVRDRSGTIVGASVIARDVTEPTLLRAELEEQAEMLDLAQDAIIARTVEGRITYWNLAAEERYGWSKKEALGQIVHDLLHTDFQAPLEELEEELFREGTWAGDLRHTTKSGSGIIVASRWGLRRDDDGQASLVIEVNNEITQQKEAEEALRLARIEADRANLFKTEFLSRMSHELRTPLNAILGFAQLLETDDLTQDQLESTDQIIKGGRRLLELINDVLDIARIESGSLRLSLEPVHVEGVVRDAVELIRPLARKRGIQLRASFADRSETLHVRADQQRLGQAMLNLLSNAVKYNVDDGEVSITALAPGDGRVRIGVSDTGPGIEEDKVALLFTPFERLGAEQTSVEGTGLGLSLSRSLIEAMGGTMKVETARGAGTTFWIELPGSGPPQSLPRGGREGEMGLTRPVRGKVLYIEDNLSNLRLIERLLERRPDVSLISAMTGNLGLELAQQHAPDLILLDLHLPDLDGEAVLARLRKDPRTNATPIVILSADATARQIEHLRQAGSTDYLTKPIDVRAFLGLIERLLGPSGSAQ